MYFHYCNDLDAALILQDQLLRPAPVLVSRDMLARDHIELAPVVWFTTVTGLEPTVHGKTVAYASGRFDLPPERTPTLDTSYWRFGVDPDSLPFENLSAWVIRNGYDPELFQWMVKTAHLIGSYWGNWRLTEQPVPAALWKTVERLDRETGTWHDAPSKKGA